MELDFGSDPEVKEVCMSLCFLNYVLVSFLLADTCFVVLAGYLCEWGCHN